MPSWRRWRRPLRLAWPRWQRSCAAGWRRRAAAPTWRSRDVWTMRRVSWGGARGLRLGRFKPSMSSLPPRSPGGLCHFDGNEKPALLAQMTQGWQARAGEPPTRCSPPGCAAGKLAEAERRLRSLDEYTHTNDTGAAVADLAARVGSVEGSVAHLAKVEAGPGVSLGCWPGRPLLLARQLGRQPAWYVVRSHRPALPFLPACSPAFPDLPMHPSPPLGGCSLTAA